FFFLHHKLKLFFRIIDPSSQTSLILTGQRISKFLVDLPFHASRSVLENMVELLVFPVHIRQQMLRSLWHPHDRLQINTFRRCSRDRRKLPGKTPQIIHFQLFHTSPFPAAGKAAFHIAGRTTSNHHSCALQLPITSLISYIPAGWSFKNFAACSAPFAKTF